MHEYSQDDVSNKKIGIKALLYDIISVIGDHTIRKFERLPDVAKETDTFWWKEPKTWRYTFYWHLYQKLIDVGDADESLYSSFHVPDSSWDMDDEVEDRLNKNLGENDDWEITNYGIDPELGGRYGVDFDDEVGFRD